MILLYCKFVFSLACENDFAGGIFWPFSGRNRLVTQQCSKLHSSFRSGVYIRRHCEDDGKWSPVDLRDCTMFIDSRPLVIVYFTLNGSVTDDSTAEDLIEVIACCFVMWNLHCRISETSLSKHL